MKQKDADMIAEAVIKKAQGGAYNEAAKMATQAPKRNPIVQVEKIENGFLIKNNDFEFGGGYKSMYARDLSEVPELLEKMFK